MPYYVYLTTNFLKTVLYTGVTNNLTQRIVEHYLNLGNQFTFAGKYGAYWLVYYEQFNYVNDAIVREKEIKGWVRKRKDALVESENPQWKFYNETLFGQWPPDTNDLFQRKDVL